MTAAAKVETAGAAADAYAMPIDEINPARPDRFQSDTIWPYFERLRREDPVHFTADSEFGPYWSITRWDDIMAVDTDNVAFSSAEGITLTTSEMGGVLHLEATFHASTYEPAMVARALELVCADPAALILAATGR